MNSFTINNIPETASDFSVGAAPQNNSPAIDSM